MALSKRFRAKQTLTLDCGHSVKAGESFGVTKLYTCESCQEWLQSGLEKRWGAAIVRPQQNHSRGGSSQDQNRNDAFIA